MTTAIVFLADDEARCDALNTNQKSLLVEAGAGSGKTAVMAGRIGLMLSNGVAPRAIAAVTFTELAASELVIRVRDFVSDLAANVIPAELRVALPGGLTQMQRDNLARAISTLDEMTCSTIHGFCQRLIKPYPAEANIDPGASVMDRAQADMTYDELVNAWLRERLSGNDAGFIAELVFHSPKNAPDLVRKMAAKLRSHPALTAPPFRPMAALVDAFAAATHDFSNFMDHAGAMEADTVEEIALFVELAKTVLSGAELATSKGLVQLLLLRPDRRLLRQNGEFLGYFRKGKWKAAAASAGLSKADGERLNDISRGHYEACCDAWAALLQNAAAEALARLIEEVRVLPERFSAHKRASAQLDFDDLISYARDLLRCHDDVRRELAKRYSHVLVDEFQDTDPTQCEIFWRLCGEPSHEGCDWTSYQIRPGALFLVGDPKQAIFRFRGADIGSYVRARDVFAAQLGEKPVSISTNFRSAKAILDFVNDRFEGPLSDDGQPGFARLDAFFKAATGPQHVTALDIRVADEDGKAKVDVQRHAEAHAVADLCARLIGNFEVTDRRTGKPRVCRPGDIALLAPTGTELWRYEEALERSGIPVATQAGKGFFRRQEVQDLIALTRILADRHDRLALGALLRGPLVGLSEEELLDIVWALPRAEDNPELVSRLDLSTDAAFIDHPLAREVVEKLQALNRRRNALTPYDLLSQAVDVMRVRPVLVQRHRMQAERALANVDLFLSLAGGYSVRGLRAFCDAMIVAWTDATRTVEGRPDAQEESVSLITMHSAKGLEWPVVIPVNTMSGVRDPDNVLIERNPGRLFCPVLGVLPAGHQAVLANEKEECRRENIRLWYVAVTRARELLVLPRSDARPARSAWSSLVDLSLRDLPAIDLTRLPQNAPTTARATTNSQTREIFASQADAIATAKRHLTWSAPSRDEAHLPATAPEADAVFWTASDADTSLDPDVSVQGGRDRGVIVHKLMEEMLTGETAETEVRDRAALLIASLGVPDNGGRPTGLNADELAACVIRTLRLPEIERLRGRLVAELPVFSANSTPEGEYATAGIVDALSFADHGQIDVVVDWKSDVAPDAKTLETYHQQVRTYLDMTGARTGYIVLMTPGSVIPVSPSPKQMAA